MNAETKAAMERIRRLKAGKEKSQDIYGVEVVDTPVGISEACRAVKRLMLGDERTIIEWALAQHRPDDDAAIDEAWLPKAWWVWREEWTAWSYEGDEQCVTLSRSALEPGVWTFQYETDFSWPHGLRSRGELREVLKALKIKPK